MNCLNHCFCTKQHPFSDAATNYRLIWNKVSKNFIGSMFWLLLIKLLIMLLLCDDFIISIFNNKNLVVPKHISILLLSLQWVLKKSKTDFLRYIGYRNFINDLIKHVSLLILVLVRLLFWENTPYLACNEECAFFTSDVCNNHNVWSCQKVCDALVYLLDNFFY